MYIFIKCCALLIVLSEGVHSRKEEIQATLEDNRIVDHTNLKLLPETCGAVKHSRLLGGYAAELYQYPWMALIAHVDRDGMNFKCSGTIINERYILTAAHCVHNKMVGGVRVGEYDLTSAVDCQMSKCETHIQDISLERSIIHEDYQGLPNVLNDIALLRLSEDIDFNHENVDRICLPTRNEQRHQTLSNKTAVLLGWGLQPGRSILSSYGVVIDTPDHCRQLYKSAIEPNESKFCAGSENKNLCLGDGGSPLILDEEYNNQSRYVQYGILSLGASNCQSNLPDVFTDVTKFMGWILDNISP